MMSDLMAASAAAADLDVDLPGPFFTFSGGPLPVSLQVQRTPAGRLVCTGVLVGWDGSATPVTARALQALRLGSMLASIGTLAREGSPADELLSVAPIADRPARPHKPGPKPRPDEHYQQVADAYRLAVIAAPDSPNVWMAHRMHASRATVGRWLRGCRERGLL